jgi:hypothetical protein
MRKVIVSQFAFYALCCLFIVIASAATLAMCMTLVRGGR